LLCDWRDLHGRKPWRQNVIAIVQELYMRANMIASGKMFLATCDATYDPPTSFDWTTVHTMDFRGRLDLPKLQPHYSSISTRSKVTLLLPH